MKRIWFFSLLAAGALIYAGCNKGNTANLAPPPAPGIPTNAQPKLQTIKLYLGTEEMITEQCLTGLQRQTGMMFRTNMEDNEGMIFVFEEPFQASFWMMNTRLPLSAAYIDPEGKILEIHDLEPFNTNSVEATHTDVQYVLETKQGWFKRHKVGVGAIIRTEKGALKKTYFGQ